MENFYTALQLMLFPLVLIAGVLGGTTLIMIFAKWEHTLYKIAIVVISFLALWGYIEIPGGFA